MADVEAHPSAEELAAFTHGTLNGVSLASVEAHMESCLSCQQRAAAVAEDPLVDLLRRAHVRNESPAVTFSGETPVPSALHSQTLAFHETTGEIAESVPA